MHHTRDSIISYLKRIKDHKIGFEELRTNDTTGFVEVSVDARYDLLNNACLFDDCTDGEAQLFLEAFLDCSLNEGWALSIELSKLLSKRGHLVSQKVETIIYTTDWTCFGKKQLFLSYLAVHPDGAESAMKLLDVVPEDFRDGLLLACYKLNSDGLDRKLMRLFVDWDSKGWGATGTGEVFLLAPLIAKWIDRYPLADLEKVIRVYFKYKAAE